MKSRKNLNNALENYFRNKNNKNIKTKINSLIN